MKYLSPKKGFLGVDAEQSIAPQVIVVPFGLEKTVSYGGGTKNGPKEIIKASHQVELFDEELNKCQLLCPTCHMKKTKNDWLSGNLYVGISKERIDT